MAVVADATSRQARALAEAGVELVQAVDLHDALRRIRSLEVRSILVEGGAELAGALLAEALVDRMIIFQAPVVLGAGAQSAFAHVPATALPDAPRWRVVGRRRIGQDLMTVYAPGAA
jgi:diaminohydroxyphosphoribosylaminopyrimidine deaminase/5-amino-6-(5-phosphoribosylamino)uracil reductase